MMCEGDGDDHADDGEDKGRSGDGGQQPHGGALREQERGGRTAGGQMVEPEDAAVPPGANRSRSGSLLSSHLAA